MKAIFNKKYDANIRPELKAVQTPVENWTINPFIQNFNPGTTAGNKIFVDKSKGPLDGIRIRDSTSVSIENHRLAIASCKSSRMMYR